MGRTTTGARVCYRPHGPAEIWLHGPVDADRPLISSPTPTTWLIGPAPSPDASRVIYSMIDPDAGGHYLWMAATAGGAPIRLTNDDRAIESTGSWSPDGNWIAYHDRGLKLISPDGKESREFGPPHNINSIGFSADSKLLYAMRQEGDQELLFSIELASGKEKIIGDAGKENGPKSNLNPATRLGIAPDGKSFAYSTQVVQENLWMLEGFNRKRGVLAALGLR